MAKSKLIIEIPNMYQEDYILFYTDILGVREEFNVFWVDEVFSDNEILEEYHQPYTRLFYDALSYQDVIENIDYKDSFTVSRENDIVTIQSNIDNLIFVDEQSGNLDVIFTNTEEDLTPEFTINNLSVVSGDCTNGTIEVETSELATKITSPISANNTQNPFTFNYLRGHNIKVTVEDANGQIASQNIDIPSVLLESDVTVDVVSSDLGNSATISYNQLYAIGTLNCTYSINGSDYFTNNVFENLDAGDYTAYVKDQFNCVVQTSFTISDVGSKEGYYYIPKTNSIRFAKREEWDGKTVFKNDENTLSSESVDVVNYEDRQYFQTNDYRTIQLRSNYDTVEAQILDEENTNTIIVSKVKEYLGLQDYRDCVIYKTEEGKTGVYFTSGDLYDYDSGAKIGDYLLNGGLPVWYKIGLFINIDNVGTLEIVKVFFDEDKNAEVAEVNFNYTGNPTLTKVKSIYNLRPFNLFEFPVNFADYNNKTIRVSIKMTDPKLDTLEWMSEFLDVKEIQPKCVEIQYYNSQNGDVFYETGIKHLIRVPIQKITDAPTSESEIHKGDNEVSVIKAEYYEGDEFEFMPQTKELSKLTELALLHTYLTINGVSYRLSENSEKTPLEDSNLYVVKAKLIKSGYSYSANTTVSIDENISIDIPGLISNGEGFISY